jgi:hypothetical protein
MARLCAACLALDATIDGRWCSPCWSDRLANQHAANLAREEVRTAASRAKLERAGVSPTPSSIAAPGTTTRFGHGGEHEGLPPPTIFIRQMRRD